MKNSAKKIKNIILIAIPIIVIIASLIWIIVGTNNKEEFSEINISVTFLNNEYILGKARARETVSDPANKTYMFEEGNSKDSFIENVLAEKDIIVDFVTQNKKIYYFIDEGRIYAVEDMLNDNSINFYYSFADVIYENGMILHLPMLNSITLYDENDLISSSSSLMPYENILCTFYDDGYRTYEDYKHFYENANKNTEIAKLNDTEKSIIVKAILFDSEPNSLGDKKVKLTFSGNGMMITYEGEGW